jgi:putative ABC transport system substrate-binding protein
VSQEAKAAILGTSIPLVFVNAFTEGSGLVESVNHPGGNVTGVRYPGPEIILQNLEMLHEIVPHAQRIYAPYDPSYPASQPVLDVIRPRAKALHLTLVEVEVNSFDALFADLAKRSGLRDPGVDAIITMPNTITASPIGTAAIGEFALAHKIPYESFVSPDDLGALFFINTDPLEAGAEAAVLVDKVLRGIPAGTIPVMSQEPYLYINYKVAQSLGITISEGVLARAKLIIR